MDQDPKMKEYEIPGTGSFKFSAISPDECDETEYTLAVAVFDITGSVSGYEDEIRECMEKILEGCKMSPRRDFIKLRVIVFNSYVDVQEIHGFMDVMKIDPSIYKNPHCTGGTPLFDACYSGIGSVLTYGDLLKNQDFDVNGAVYIITDGDDNDSTVTPNDVKSQMVEALKGEKIESILSVLIGLNTKQCGTFLKTFKDEAELTHYIDGGDLTPEILAKLSGFISSSISSQSQKVGTGASAKVKPEDLNI